MDQSLNIWFLVAVALLSPRQSETFTGNQMVRVDKALSLAAVVPPEEEDIQPLTVMCSDPGQFVDGYIFKVWNQQFTNTYTTEVPWVSLKVTNRLSRVFATVTVTNHVGEADCPKVGFWPPYPPDRMDLLVSGVASFSLQTSTDRKTWTQSTVAGKTTVLLAGAPKYYRVQGITNALQFAAYNPLNE